MEMGGGGGGAGGKGLGGGTEGGIIIGVLGNGFWGVE